MNLKYCVFLLIFSLCSAQIKKEKGVVFYGEIRCLRSGAKNGPERIALLVFDKTQSSYVVEKDSLDNLQSTEFKEFYENKSGKGGSFIMGSLYKSKCGFQVYTNWEKDSVFSTYVWENYVYVKEKKVTIDWKLINETKKIGNFECKKAIGTFRGREYTAWYAEDIPIPYGPWKLQGLPGLILEAYNKEQEIYFVAKNVDYPSKSTTEISKVIKPKDMAWLSQKEFLKWSDDRLQEIYERLLLMKIKGIRAPMVDEFKEISE